VNSIVTKQNEPRMLSLVRARRRIYWTAKRYQGAIVLGTLLLPVISLAVATFYPAARSYVAVAAILFGLCEVVLMDRWHRAQMKDAAKLQEHFDCEVLEMRGNSFLVGANVDPEEVYRLSAKTLNPKQEAQLRDWYPVAVGKVPLHIGRIMCQRENLLYDGNVRKSYGRVLKGALLLLAVLLLGYSLAAGLKVDALVLTVLVPAMPVVNWVLRECARQRDTVETLLRLKAESEKLWKSAVDGLSPHESADRSRELQDAIYNHRVVSPLVFDFMYRVHRKDFEAQMNAGAEHLAMDYVNKNIATA